MQTDQLLNLFIKHKDEWLSGNELADKLSISRTMIWKMIRNLKQLGHQIESKKNAGYKYVGSNNFDRLLIQQNLHAPFEIQTFNEIDSTNTYAKKILSQSKISDPIVIVADKQTAGHGRRGREFYSPKDTGIYMSMILPINDNAVFDGGLITTMTAVATVHGLKKSYPNVNFQLKWVNDIYVNNKKVSGILTESVMDVELMHPSALVIGIGINLNSNNFPKDMGRPIGAISNNQVDKNKVVADILNAFYKLYPNYQKGEFMDEYRQLSMLINHQVQIETHRGLIAGKVIDFDHHGRLILDNGNETKAIMTGEVVKVHF
ncbi:biotin--[acetyl-CoA-carboxylase] ligase [Apilactobacillus micheneri]|uniref:Bifunctional ligase/repressor BirA n=1 Tax=Apilactobacillus micheneri TaxID=1899430 RepID=A0ABY2Z0N3_9LACO|nr:biotin--[acetyl-CoA-carboxylase] ligase [Apilactobacillus micheneri]TPR24490.1 biotin--[acetyl-CoA-carboxylase] ligase [Apilactobacillus micheneri]TPR25801.1 biotin--[acetyl-CoA-carboxylase] ligase [Apilactobacillus micheneri]TPR27991.1 biotin--[acetyl-CoA-carboxylase] ligase [Apilactobacillus micheneri]TPR29482.1 biotin--[acetyl-CoA-carboxylase] ligase [Apilactobacillus micheneri]TPR30268.1 biotin--[acetyl-CoA-carboxylase] ligase [Apilactobacillus micheneri]